MENNNKKSIISSMGPGRNKPKPSKEALDNIAKAVNDENQKRAYGDKIEEQSESTAAIPAIASEPIAKPVTASEVSTMPELIAEPIKAVKEPQTIESQEVAQDKDIPVLEVEKDTSTNELSGQKEGGKKAVGKKKAQPKADDEDQEITTLSVTKALAKKVKYASTLMTIDQRKFVTDAIDFYIQHCKKTGKLVPIEL